MLCFAALIALSGATIQVDVSKTQGPLNRLVLGSNLVDYQKGGYGDPSPSATNEGEGIWDPVKRRPSPGMVALARQAGMSIARWPGGCAAHLYEWKRTIGPLSDRPDQLFGLPEYLATCQAIGAEPLITVAEYFGTAQDAADLVEYLNSADDGNHPWAAKRAADGHKAPWGVNWFEFGNESDHGPHRSNDDNGKLGPAYSPEQYAARYLAYRTAMKSIDPHLRLGAVISTGLQDLRNWPTNVARRIGPSMDFAIFHSYLPSVGENAAPPEKLFPDALAGEDQIQEYVDELRSMLAEATGRPVRGPQSTPIAVTEFNGGFVQEKPVPYRHSLGNALVVADMIDIWLRPRNGVVFANFWEFPNEYWGMVRGYENHGQTLVARPQYFAAQLFAQHFGTQLLSSTVTCPTYSTVGNASIGIEPHSGAGSKLTYLESVWVPPAWQISPIPKVEQTTDDGVLKVQFNDPGDLNYYHAFVETNVLPNTSYRVTAWVKTEGLPAGNGACYQIGDSRGWVVTHSAEITPWINGTSGWKQVEAVYTTLPDSTRLQIVARRLSGTGPVTGTAWYKNVTVTRIIRKSLAAVPTLTVSASRDDDGHRVFLIVTNKDLHQEVSAMLRLSGFVANKARAWSLTGPTADATNEIEPTRVGIHEFSVTVDAVRFPPCSVTAVELDGKLMRASSRH